MGKKSSPAAPEPIDASKSMGEYLFGKDFSSFQGITDPELQKRLIGAEKEFRPQYTALELADINVMAQGLGDQKGLFQLLEEQSRQAGELQRSELQKQRGEDVAALQEFSPQVVEAYRAADPYSTGLADLASRRAQKDLGLGAKGQQLLASKLKAAGKAEQKLLKAGASLADLTPTEQEALLKKRGMEFAESTGQLSPLEQRNVQQQARLASQSRGREMGSLGQYGEMQARMSEELGKREREMALGSQLLGQEAGLRAQRMGLGAGMLSSSELMAAQRRAELLQKQQLGAGLIGQEASIGSQRLGQAYGMQRGISGDLGATILGRPSQSIGLGGQVLGHAQQGAAGQMGPQLFDPNMGVNIAMQNQANQTNYAGAMAQAGAARSAGTMGMLGKLGGAAIGLCWVAREVYGESNPNWLKFRSWLLSDAPSWFVKLYAKHGERFAKFISNKPLLKSAIRSWMNSKI